MRKKVKLTISLDYQLVKELKHLAIDKEKTVSEIVEAAIRRELNKIKKKRRKK